MLLKVDLEDLETVLNALYQANEKELLMKFKTDAQNMIWAMSEGSEHLTKHIHQWNDEENDLIMEEKIPQSFSDFDFEEVKKLFSLKNKRDKLFQKITERPVSIWLQEGMDFAQKKRLRNEKARSEYLIAPILTEIEKGNTDLFQVFSGEYLNIDKNKGLKGEFDFVFVADAEAEQVTTPLITVVEAKTGDIIQHWGQVVAQMVGAREFNKQNENYEFETIFGCLTTGELWHFVKLENDLITIDEKPYYLLELPQILGVFQEIIDFYKVKEKKKI